MESRSSINVIINAEARYVENNTDCFLVLLAQNDNKLYEI